jgi:hypothetical protein
MSPEPTVPDADAVSSGTVAAALDVTVRVTVAAAMSSGTVAAAVLVMVSVPVAAAVSSGTVAVAVPGISVGAPSGPIIPEPM